MNWIGGDGELEEGMVNGELEMNGELVNWRRGDGELEEGMPIIGGGDGGKDLVWILAIR